MRPPHPPARQPAPLLLATLLVALALPAAGLAAPVCEGTRLLSCPIGRKELDLCLTTTALRYSFGPAGAPELVLTTPIAEAAYQPWSGVGGSIWDAVAFPHRDITYEVWTSLDRNDPGAIWQGGVNVLQGESLLAELTCAPGTVQGDLTAIFTAKEAAGQCWSHDAFRWQTTCP